MNAILEQFTIAQLSTALRGLALYGLGALVTNGVITEDERQTAAGVIVGAVLLGYGIYKRRANGLIQSAANVGTVEKIVTDAKTADKVPSRKVVPPAVDVAAH